MTIRDDWMTVTDFWRLYRRLDALRRSQGNDMWEEALRLCGDFGNQRGSLAKKLCLAMLDEFEERIGETNKT